MFNFKLKRCLTKQDYESVKWMSYYACGAEMYDEGKILRVAEIVEEYAEDESEGLVYSKWITNIANGKEFNWHKLQSFCIEMMEKYAPKNFICNAR